MIVVGIGISLFLNALNVAGHVPHSHFFDFLTAVVITIIVWEGNLRIDTLMNIKFPWEKSPGNRILAHLPVSLIFSTLAIYFSMLAFNKFVCQFPDQAKERFMVVAVIIGIMVTLTTLSIEISTQFFTKWKQSLVEVEKYKTESLQAQLKNLKDQVNPHFLFNNMSVLSSLVYKDQDKAVDFINQLSKVYRYLLDTRNSEMVSLSDELTFVNSYTYLLSIRFDSSLIFKIDIAKEQENKLLPPMALQILIENVIKHNEISTELPLTIGIKTIGDVLEVSNNLQLRSDVEPGSKTGLRNIRERYSFFTKREVEVIETKTSFTVRIPLLKGK